MIAKARTVAGKLGRQMIVIAAVNSFYVDTVLSKPHQPPGIWPVLRVVFMVGLVLAVVGNNWGETVSAGVKTARNLFHRLAQ